MASGGLSKAAKKNLKRKEKKNHISLKSDNCSRNENNGSDLESILNRLNVELDQAKLEKNNPRLMKLREQIWVVTDMLNGVKTNMSDAELREVVKDLFPKENPKSGQIQSDVKPSSMSQDITTEPEKRLRNLRKKLKQIITLKDKQAEGQALESNQLNKLNSESFVLKEIEELEALISQAMP